MNKNTKKTICLAMVTVMTFTVVPLNVLRVEAETNSINQNREQNMIKENPQKPTLLENMVSKAEVSQSGEDVYLASLLVDKLRDADKEALTARLDAIEVTNQFNSINSIKHAEKEVYLAEKVGNDNHIRKAQEYVSNLFLSVERTALIERIQEILLQEK